MEHRRRSTCCTEEFHRVHRDIDWTLKTVRHVNKKLENHKNGNSEWCINKEECRVKEWLAQIQHNNQLKLEIKELKDTVKEQGAQLAQLKQLINGLFLNLGIQTTRSNLSAHEAGTSAQSTQNTTGFHLFSGSR